MDMLKILCPPKANWECMLWTKSSSREQEPVYHVLHYYAKRQSARHSVKDAVSTTHNFGLLPRHLSMPL
jgi:hypothetical protein